MRNDKKKKVLTLKTYISGTSLISIKSTLWQHVTSLKSLVWMLVTLNLTYIVHIFFNSETISDTNSNATLKQTHASTKEYFPQKIG
jgi:hypothetical protein